MKNKTTTKSRVGDKVNSLVGRIPIDYKAIAKESGCTKGTLCKTAFGWGVQNGNGEADFCCITPPETNANEELRIEGNDWVFYSSKRLNERRTRTLNSLVGF